MLDVQEIDSRVDRLRHRRSTLPELARIADLRQQHEAATDRLLLARTDVEDLGREQRKADADVEQVRARRTRNQERLDRGQVGSPRELESLQHELGSLDRRIGDLEDAELDVMERVETAQAELDRLQASITGFDTALAELEQHRDRALTEIDDDTAQAAAERADLVTGMREDLLTLYEKLRGSHDGVGAAALVQRRCGGCRLELNAADLRVIAAADDDEVLRCEECNRILVRTAESGI